MKIEKFQKNACIAFGLASIVFFIFDFVVFNQLRPKMVSFQPITLAEESLFNWVGVGLLVFLVFCLLSLFRIARHLRNIEKINVVSIILVSSGVLSLLFIFSDVALLNDISKQYQHDLSQPEWYLVYPIVGGQLITAIVFTCLHFSGWFKTNRVQNVVRDSNVFLIVNYVGLICGLMGLSLSSLGFLFSRSWSLLVHTTISSIILLIPYFLAVSFWLVTKFQEKPRMWYDEKQLQDVGKSAFLTLVISVVLMAALFVTNYNNLGGVISITWLPLYLFSVLFLFSLGNLYYSRKR